MRQGGFSFFGVLFFLAILGGIVSIVVKILPPWIDFMAVSEATQSVLAQPRIGLQRQDEVLAKIDKQLSINNIEINSLGDKPITLSRDGGVLTATIDYSVEQPVFSNEEVTININMQFYKTHEVSLKDE